jgi:putative ABC transport system permease protein
VTPQFLTLFRWHVLRYVARHKLLALLNVLSVALGVAVYLAIQIANRSANESFAAGVDLVAGKAHLEARGQITDELWPKIARVEGVSATTAIIEGVATLPAHPGEYLRLVGVDVFTSVPFRTFEIGSTAQRLDLEKWLGESGSIAVTQEFAQRTGLKVGDPLDLQVNATTVPARIVALIDLSESVGDSRVAAIDLGWAQEILAQQGRLASVQIRADEPKNAERLAEAIRRVVPPDVRINPPRQRSFQMQTMLSAFQLNLTAMSLVSLLVGTFLVYNTIYASVVRRRTELGILRALGVTRTEIRWLFLGEACVFGFIGIVLGGVGGVLLGRVMIGAVEKTISSLYVLMSIERVSLDPWQFALAGIFGIAAVIAGAWMPANEAAQVDPISTLSLGGHAEASLQNQRQWRWWAIASLGLAAILCAAALRSGPPLLAFGGAFLVLAGFAFSAPVTTELITGSVPRLIRGWYLLRMAGDHLRRSLHRSAVTIAALATAVAMVIGLTVMIHSFRQSLTVWIEQGVVADLFIAPASNETIGLGSVIPPEAIAWLREQPGVDSVDSFREVSGTARIQEGDQPVLMAVTEGRYRNNLQVEGRGGAEGMQRVFRGEAIAITESLARRWHLREGMTLSLLTPKGLEGFPIAAVYTDYSRDQGAVLMAHRRFVESWQDHGPMSLGVYLKPNTEPRKLAEEFVARFGSRGEFIAYSNRELRSRIFAIFDQTFAVTYVLRTIALLVAVIGIFLSVTTVVAERQRETGMLRAVGASRSQIAALFMAEAGLIGTAASVLGIVTGLALALVLTWVVNPAFFGWTIHLHIPTATIAATPLWVVAATILAAWWPAWRGALEPIATAVREE